MTSDKIAKNNTIVFAFRDNELLINIDFSIPSYNDIIVLDIDSSKARSIGKIDDNECVALGISEEINLNGKLRFQPFRKLYSKIDRKLFEKGMYAMHLLKWDAASQFCGYCGSKTEHSDIELAKVCTNCDSITYPQLAPAIIVAVVKDEKILLGRASRFSGGMYSTLAGYLEPGETLEECVAREVKEESGIEIKNIQYFGNQFWPFSSSLMIGFTAEYQSGEIIIDNEELEDAKWFSKDELPIYPDNLSIAGQLIEWFKAL